MIIYILWKAVDTVQAAVVIPIYKETLSKMEKLSLKQAKTILYKWPMYFMAPETMRGFCAKEGIEAQIFPNTCFASTISYSKLLLTPDFYRKFLKYEYILIYQLDAFVFSDRLAEFCALGYDYIGAPIPRCMWEDMKNRVGNGGLSLRKVASCIHVTEHKDDIFVRTNKKEIFEECEDKFFAYCGQEDSIRFRTADIHVARQFSVEYNLGHSWEKISATTLPFGCHKWPGVWRYLELTEKERTFLKKICKKMYDEKLDFYRRNLRPYIEKYLRNRILQNYRATANTTADRYLPASRKYILWGNGKAGKEARKFMDFFGRKVVYIFDRNVAKGETAMGIPVIVPDTEMIRSKRYIIIIGTSKYKDEIETELVLLGLNKGTDFFVAREIEHPMTIAYYAEVWKRLKSFG